MLLNPPDGFEPLGYTSGFSNLVGPIFALQDNEVLRIGFRCENRHDNRAGGLHGGMLATFADIVLCCGAIYHGRLETGVITITLKCDFLSAAKAGDWVEGTSQLQRVTRSMVFVEGMACVGDRQLLRANAVFKIGAPRRHDWIKTTRSAT